MSSLSEHHIAMEVCFDELAGRDCVYWVRDAHGVCEVSFIERGRETFYQRFSSEEEALAFLHWKHSHKPRPADPADEDTDQKPVIYL